MLPLLARPLAEDVVDMVDEAALGGEDKDAIVMDGGAFDLRPLLVVTVDMWDFEDGERKRKAEWMSQHSAARGVARSDYRYT